MSIPNPELLRRVDPNDIPEGSDGPLGADPNDPDVKRLERSLWGDESKIVTDASMQEARSEQQMADLIDRKGPEAVTAYPDQHVHHATVDDAHTFALIDEPPEDARPGIEAMQGQALAAMQSQALAEEVETREREVIASLKDVPPLQEEVDAALTKENP